MGSRSGSKRCVDSRVKSDLGLFDFNLLVLDIIFVRILFFPSFFFFNFEGGFRFVVVVVIILDSV